MTNVKRFVIPILLLLCSSPAVSSGYPKDFDPHKLMDYYRGDYKGYDGNGTGEIWGRLEVAEFLRSDPPKRQ
jgi:hypothetical protein